MWPELSPWEWWAIALSLAPALAFPTLFEMRSNIAAWCNRNKIISAVGVAALIVSVLVIVKLFDANVLQVPEQFAYSRVARPYLTLVNAEVFKNDKSTEEFSVSMQNNSDLPAEDVVGQLVLIPDSSDMDVPPIIGEKLTTSSMGPRGPQRRLWMDVYLQPNTRPAFIVFQMKYNGPLSNKLYSERSYHKFLGWPAEDESFERKLVGTTVDENNWIEEFIKKHEVPML